MGKGFSPIVVAIMLIAATVAASSVLYVQIKTNEQTIGKTPMEPAAPAETVQQPAVQPSVKQPSQQPSGQQPVQQSAGAQLLFPDQPSEIPVPAVKQPPQAPPQQPIQPLPDISMPPFPDQPINQPVALITTATTPFPGCIQLDSARNDMNDNSRITIVLVGINFTTQETMQNGMASVMGIGSDTGLFSAEPFMSNRNKFNLFFVNRIDLQLTVQIPLVLENFRSSVLALSSPCNYPNRKIMIFINYDTLESYQAGHTLQFLGFADRQFVVDRIIFPAPDNLYRAENMKVTMHEAGHMIGLLGHDALEQPLTEPNAPSATRDICYYASTQSLACSTIPGIEPPVPYCDFPAQAVYDNCNQQAPWHDLVGNGCGQEGIIDCNENQRENAFEIKCTFPRCSPNAFGATEASIMGHTGANTYLDAGRLPFFSQNEQRVICRRIKEITGFVGGVCNSLCLNGCALGEKCVQGACRAGLSTS